MFVLGTNFRARSLALTDHCGDDERSPVTHRGSAGTLGDICAGLAKHHCLNWNRSEERSLRFMSGEAAAARAAPGDMVSSLKRRMHADLPSRRQYVCDAGPRLNRSDP